MVNRKFDDPVAPIPAGATVSGWRSFTHDDGELIRYVTWYSKQAEDATVHVQAIQLDTGRVARPTVVVTGTAEDLTAYQARNLAAALVEAADELDRLL